MSLKITWLGQAGYLLKTDRTSIIIDPYFSNSVADQGFIRLYEPPVRRGEIQVDYAMATHDHGDHLDIETLKEWIGFKDFYGPGSCVKMMGEQGFEEGRLHTLDRNQSAQLGDTRVSAVHAEHTADSIGIVVEYQGKRLYFSGDTTLGPQTYTVLNTRPDIMFICINGKFGNMTWQEADTFAHFLKVKTVVPNHYDLFAINKEDPALFINAFEGSFIRARLLEVGKELELEELL